MTGSNDDNERLRQLQAFFTPTKDELRWRQEQLRYLASIADEWRRRESRPESCHGLSTYEFAAVCLAAGHPEALDNALVRFFGMDGWLQRWVLEQNGLTHMAGTKVGEAS